MLNFCQFFEYGRISILPAFCFLENDIRERQKYEKRIQTFVDNIVNDFRYEIKFENSVRDKNKFCIKRKIFFFKQKYIFLCLETYFFKISKNLTASAFFFAKADTKKHRYASAKASAFADCRGEF